MTGANLRTLGTPDVWARRSLDGDAPDLAPALLGALLIREEPAAEADGPTILRVIETEAYRQDDPASHTFAGRTDRNAVMFGPPGHAYVYFTYGMHFCVNVVVGAEGQGSAVLLRAGLPLTNLDLVRSRRPAAKRDRDLVNGPAKLTQALAVDRSLDGVDLLDPSSPLRLEHDGWRPEPDEIVIGPRVGVRLAADVPWRFALAGVPEVSRYSRHQRASRSRP